MDFVKFIEKNMLTEMARKVENLDLDAVKETMKELKSAGIDLSKYTFDEIVMAFFFNLDELIRGTTPKHQETVISYWKPGNKNATKTYNDVRQPFIAAMNIDLDTVKTFEAGKNDRDDRHPVRISLGRKALVGLSKDPDAIDKFRDNIKKKETLEE